MLGVGIGWVEEEIEEEEEGRRTMSVSTCWNSVSLRAG